MQTLGDGWGPGFVHTVGGRSRQLAGVQELRTSPGQDTQRSGCQQAHPSAWPCKGTVMGHTSV